jgi:hypothetical protein
MGIGGQMLENVLSLMNLQAIARSSQAFTREDYLLTSLCARDNAFFCVRNVRLELLYLASGTEEA